MSFTNKDNVSEDMDSDIKNTIAEIADDYESSDDVDYNPLEESQVEETSDEEMDVSALSLEPVTGDEVADIIRNLTEDEIREVDGRYPDLREQIKELVPQHNAIFENDIGKNITNVDLEGYDSSADVDYKPLDNTVNTATDGDTDMSDMSETEMEDMCNSAPPNEASKDAPKKRVRLDKGAASGDCFSDALLGYDSNADDDYAEETAESDESISGEEMDNSMVQAEEAESLREEITMMGVQPETIGFLRSRGGN